MEKPCPECNRLRLVHAEAIRAQTNVLWRCFQAAERKDQTAIASLAPMKRLAGRARSIARETRDVHEASHEAA